MKLADLINKYVNWKRSLGMRFQSDSETLNAFQRKLGSVEITEVRPDDVLNFLNGNGAITSYWHQKFKILNGFYRFSIMRGHATASPLPKTTPKHPPPSPPHIYSTEELRRLLKATDSLETRTSPLQADTFRTLFIVLYSTGLRVNEARQLSIADVNISERLIMVRGGKFHKTRLVPIGPKLAEALSSYAKQRRRLLRPKGNDSAFFCTRTGKSLSYDRIGVVFRRLRALSHIRREADARYQPRIHDLRHTAAVHRLISWYRSGKDLNRLLPALSTYLGHVDLSSTQRYLTVTFDILNEAGNRFEKYAQPEDAKCVGTP